MFYFEFEESAIFQALKRKKEYQVVIIFKKIFLIGLIISLFFFLLFSLKNFSFKTDSKAFGFLILFLSSFIAFWNEELFFNSRLKKPKPNVSLKTVLSSPEKFNLVDFLDFEAGKIIERMFFLAKEKQRSEIDSLLLLLSIFKEEKSITLNFVFNHLLLDPKEFQRIIYSYLVPQREEFSKRNFSQDFQETIFLALKIADEKKKEMIGPGDLFSALSEKNPLFKKILIELKLKPEDVKEVVWWVEEIEKEIEERKKFWEWKNLIKMGSVGKEWAAGYALTLERFSTDLSKLVMRAGFPETIGHKEALEAVERILARRESRNNVLIVGEAGTGRKSIVQALAKKSFLGESLPGVNFKRVVQLNLSSLLAQAVNLDEAEIFLDKIFREVVHVGNIILFIDEIHNFLGLGGVPQPGRIDIAGSLAPFLHLIDFQIVATTTYEGLHKNIESNPSILTLFEKVEVSEISERDTLRLLERMALKLERKYHILIPYPTLRVLMEDCKKYLPAVPFPEKALHFLDEVIVHVAQKKSKVVLPRDIAKLITEKTQIPVGEIETKEREILLNLEKLIHQRIINQEEAVKEVSAALRRARAQIQVRKGPMGSFLFLGPTGVGKTETSKALAEIYFGSESRMIRIDMSEFQNIEDISRLIGSSREEGLLTTPVRENPFSLILLDEFEKAHLNILNLFLQVFDEGHLTDGLGRKVDFKNTMIIATSNAGYQLIFKTLKDGLSLLETKEKLINFVVENGIFRPELLNRFDAVVLFRPLDKDNLSDIAGLILEKIKKQLKEKEIDFVIEESLKEKIVELSYKPEFGARQMQRVVQDKIGNVLAEAILKGEIKRGERITINPITFALEKK